MKITNGIGRPVRFAKADIKREASQNGATSIVTAECDNGTVEIMQHGSGTWDIAVDDNHEAEYNDDDEAVNAFIVICQRLNK